MNIENLLKMLAYKGDNMYNIDWLKVGCRVEVCEALKEESEMGVCNKGN